MNPYEFGFRFEPNEYDAMLDLNGELKRLGRSCKALIKKAGRRMKKK
jgi:hypothetical protein